MRHRSSLIDPTRPEQRLREHSGRAETWATGRSSRCTSTTPDRSSPSRVSYLKKHQNVRLVSLMIGAQRRLRVSGDHGGPLHQPDRAGGADRDGLQERPHDPVGDPQQGALQRASWRSSTTTRSTTRSDGRHAQSDAAQPGRSTRRQGRSTSRSPMATAFAASSAAAAAHSGGNTCTAGLLTQLTGAAPRAGSTRATPELAPGPGARKGDPPRLSVLAERGPAHNKMSRLAEEPAREERGGSGGGR